MAAYARHRGVSHAAVTQAIRAGKLLASVVHDAKGRPKIRSIKLADEEWANASPNGKTAVDLLAEQGIPSLAVSRARYQAAKASMATMELLEKKKKLIPIEKARAEIADVFSTLRTRLLAIPTDARQRIPKLTDDDAGVLDALVREALEGLATEIG